MTSFADRLADAVRRCRTPLCVGIDPRWESLPLELRRAANRDLTGIDVSDPVSLEAMAEAFLRFGRFILERCARLVPCVKFQAAFFESCGPAGFVALRSLIRTAHELGHLVILDGKRNDIASTATAYADASFGGVQLRDRREPIWDADAITINPYLGRDAVEPFLTSARSASRGVFVLVRTSNPGSGSFQNLDCGGVPLYRKVAEAVALWNATHLGSCGLGDVGAVIGATHPTELAELRSALPAVWFLIPGYGAQGGAAEDVRWAFRADGLGAIINSSRGITFPFLPDSDDWRKAIDIALTQSIAELRMVSGL